MLSIQSANPCLFQGLQFVLTNLNIGAFLIGLNKHTSNANTIYEAPLMSKLSSIEFKVTWKANIEEFWIKYFHLICHLILTKINCITLEIRSKADFKSKSQNIWQQMLSRTVMQRICAWHKIRTLSGRLSLMRNV